MNKAATAMLIPIVAIVVALGGCTTMNPPAALAPAPTQPGVFEFEVGNSLYPMSRGASVGFQRHLTIGQEVSGSLEWKGNEPIRYKWSLYVYAPDGNTMLSWSGADFEHDFRFTPTTSGTYKFEILKRDFSARYVRLTIVPTDWNRWGEE